MTDSGHWKEIDERTTNLLHGYTRSIAIILDCIIPEEIVMLLISFYYVEECFAIFDKKTYNISNPHYTQITHIGRPYARSSIYGNKLIPDELEIKGIRYIWHFKINQIKSQNGSFIGLASKSDINTNNIFAFDGMRTYAISLNGNKWRGGALAEISNLFVDQGDQLIMEYDDKLHTLSFSKPNVDNIICLNKVGIDTQYRMALYMTSPSDQIELLSFNTI